MCVCVCLFVCCRPTGITYIKSKVVENSINVVFVVRFKNLKLKLVLKSQ